jgi:hypothetical protein
VVEDATRLAVAVGTLRRNTVEAVGRRRAQVTAVKQVGRSRRLDNRAQFIGRGPVAGCLNPSSILRRAIGTTDPCVRE